MAATTIPVPTEAEEAKYLMQYLKIKKCMFTHIKNETGRAVRGRRVRNWKAVWDAIDGVSPGFPDYLIIVSGQLIAIELKRTKGGTVSTHQKAWLEALNAAHIPAYVCKGFSSAKEVIDKHLKEVL